MKREIHQITSAKSLKAVKRGDKKQAGKSPDDTPVYAISTAKEVDLDQTMKAVGHKPATLVEINNRLRMNGWAVAHVFKNSNGGYTVKIKRGASVVVASGANQELAMNLAYITARIRDGKHK